MQKRKLIFAMLFMFAIAGAIASISLYYQRGLTDLGILLIIGTAILSAATFISGVSDAYALLEKVVSGGEKASAGDKFSQPSGGDVYVDNKTVINFLFQFGSFFVTAPSTETSSNTLESFNVNDRQVLPNLRQDFEATIQGLDDREREILLDALRSWIGRLIERYKDFDDYSFPYGEFCGELVNSLATGKMLYLSQVLFDSKLAERIGEDKSIFPSVYLPTLSRQFPQTQKPQKPVGYYIWRSDYNRYTEPIIMSFVTDKKWKGWKSLNFTPLPHEVRTQSLGEQVSSLLYKTLGNRKSSMVTYKVVFKTKEVEYHNLGTITTDYLLSLQFHRFSSFLIAFATDILRCGSYALRKKREHKENMEDLQHLFSSQS